MIVLALFDHYLRSGKLVKLSESNASRRVATVVDPATAHYGTDRRLQLQFGRPGACISMKYMKFLLFIEG
jgi:hypothetical protein